MTTREITLTKDGGFYYRALIFHYALLSLLIIPVLLVTVSAVVNPFWFRESFMRWVEITVHKITHWRDKIKYRIYLGTDPEMWHALKDKE